MWLHPFSVLASDTPEYLIYGSPPPGWRIEPGGLLSLLGYGYGGLVEAVQGLRRYGYIDAPWGYDFRKGALRLGFALGEAIEELGAQYDHKIVCHSYGGLVSQVALGYLKGRNKDSLVSTVLAIAPIFNGSYSTCRTWRVEEDSLNQMALARALVGSPFRGVAGFGENRSPEATFTRWMRGYLRAFVSFPSTYDMLPNPDKDDFPDDTQRALAWDPAAWELALVPPDAGLMQESRLNFQVQIRTPAYRLDQNKWLIVAGQDLATPTAGKMLAPQRSGGLVNLSRITLAERRARLPGLGYGLNGDNRATLESQERVPGSLAFALYCSGAHADLQTHPAVLRNLSGLLNITGETIWPFSVQRAFRDAAGQQWPVRA